MIKQLAIALIALVLPAAPCFAAYAFVQQTEMSTSSSGTQTTPSITVGAGDLLVVVEVVNAAMGTTPTDGDVGNTYTQACISAKWNSTFYTALYYSQNSAAGATAITVPSTAYAVYVAEYSGVATTDAYISGSCVTAANVGPGAGANVLSSGNSDVTAQPALLFALTSSGGQTMSFSPTAGTSPTAFTGRTPVWEPWAPTVAIGTPEDTRITSTGNVAATFGVTTGGGGQFDGYMTIAAAFEEASGSASCTNDGYTSAGALTVPTAGTTSVWLENGSFATVDCSSTEYWQPENGGVFGVN